MNYLAFDTSGTYLTTVVGGEKSEIRYVEKCSQSHSVILMDEVEKILSDSGLDLNDIDVFACSVGPGSFTGIRIGVSTAKAFAYALSKKVLPVTSFEILAYNITESVDKLTLIDARHDNFYVCGFNSKNQIVLPPSFMTKDEVVSLSKDYVLVSDCKIDGIESVVGDLAKGFKLAIEDKINLASDNVEDLIPLYVKRSQAEEELC